MIQYPMSYPQPLIDGSTSSESPGTLDGEFEGYFPTVHITSDAPVSISVLWRVKAIDYEKIYNFWRYNLAYGSKEFEIQLPGPSYQFEKYAANWLTEFQANKIGVSIFWEITATLSVRQLINSVQQDITIEAQSDSFGANLALLEAGVITQKQKDSSASDSFGANLALFEAGEINEIIKTATASDSMSVALPLFEAGVLQ